MCICMYVWLCVCVYVCMYPCVYCVILYGHVLFVCMCLCLSVCMYVYVIVFMYVAYLCVDDVFMWAWVFGMYDYITWWCVFMYVCMHDCMYWLYCHYICMSWIILYCGVCVGLFCIVLCFVVLFVMSWFVYYCIVLYNICILLQRFVLCSAGFSWCVLFLQILYWILLCLT